MGHRDVKTAMRYQHPELEVVRAALDYGTASETAEMRPVRQRDAPVIQYQSTNAGHRLRSRIQAFRVGG